MKTKEEIIKEEVGLSVGGSLYAPMDKGECMQCMEKHADQEKQALKDEFIKKVKESNLSGLSKATVYTLITQL